VEIHANAVHVPAVAKSSNERLHFHYRYCIWEKNQRWRIKRKWIISIHKIYIVVRNLSLIQN